MKINLENEGYIHKKVLPQTHKPEILSSAISSKKVMSQATSTSFLPQAF